MRLCSARLTVSRCVRCPIDSFCVSCIDTHISIGDVVIEVFENTVNPLINSSIHLADGNACVCLGDAGAIFLQTLPLACMHTYNNNAHMHRYIHTCIHVYILHIYVHTFVHVFYIYMHTYTYMHMHAY